jgi:hypothetical protein
LSDGAYALAGAVLGIAAATLANIVGFYRADRKEVRDLVRSICVSFIAEIMKARQASIRLYDEGSRQSREDEQEISALNTALAEGQALYEKLRLTADSMELQEAARLCLHHVYWLSRVGLGTHTDWTEQHDALWEWLEKLHVRARRELGIKHPENIYRGRSRGLPTPPRSL